MKFALGLYTVQNYISSIFILLVSLSLSVKLYAAHKFSKLPELLKPGPYCSGKISFDVAKDNFVEIANELPGVQDYNELIKFYQKKEWAKFKTGLQQYKKIYETSPLLEAIQFLEVQALFEQIDRTDYNDSAEAEKMLKQVVLLYPKSELVPVLYASVASLWLNDGLIQKALGFFEKIKKDYPVHPLSCLFQLGSAESSYLMHDYETAKRNLTQILQKCTERKYLVGAQIRLNDIELRKNNEKFTKEYEKPFYSDVNFVNRFFPFVLYNLGELKFRAKEYESSKLFFTEFAKYGGKDPICGPQTLKRLADLSMLMNDDIQTVVGKYLSVQEQSPLSDIGRYSFVHAMYLQFADVGEIEQTRRIKITDAEIEKISNYDMRTLAFLEKGLALLSSGRREALEFLTHLSDRTNYDLKKGELADYIRVEVVSFLEKEASERVEKSGRVDTLDDESILEPYEKVYANWLKGTVYEERSKLFYEKILLSRYEKALKRKDGLAAVAKIVRWKKTELWRKKGLSAAQKKKLGDSLALLMKGLNQDEIVELSRRLKRYRKEMEEIYNPEYHLLLVALDLPNTTKEEIQKHYQDMQKSRALASVSNTVSSEARSYLYRVKGKMLFAIGKSKEAEEFFLKANLDKSQRHFVERELVQLYEENKNYSKLLKSALAVYDTKPPSEDRLHYLDTARAAVNIGKIWSQSKELLNRAEKYGLKDKELMPYQLLVARGHFESGKYSESVVAYEKLLKEELPTEEVAGAKFRLAKSYAQTKRKVEATKLFEEVSTLNDSFWSPLASSEKNLLELK